MAVWLFQVAFDYYLVNVLYRAVCVVYTARSKKSAHVQIWCRSIFSSSISDDRSVNVFVYLYISLFSYFKCTNYNILIKIKIIRRIVTMIMIIMILLSLETNKNIKVYIAWTNIYIFLQEFHFAIVFYQKRMLTAKWKYFLLNNFKMLSTLAPFHFLACSKF